MTPEERIAALEAQVAEMSANFKTAVALMQFLGGSERVFQSAVLTLVQHFPNKEAIRADLQNLTARAENAVLFDSHSEDHVQGARDARELLLLWLDKPLGSP